MFRTLRPVLVDLETELRSLPADHVVFVLEDAWLVVGPTGVFVVAHDDCDLDSTAVRVAGRADAVRARLADEMPVVPFVDAVVTTNDVDFDPVQPALVIPVDLVRFTICEGRTIVEGETLARLTLLGLPRLR